MKYLAVEAAQRRTPRAWPWIPLRRVASLRREPNSFRRATLLSVSASAGVRARDESGGRQLATVETESKYWIAHPGDLVFNPMWAIEGGVAVSGLEGAVSTAYRVYALAPSVHPRFLHYFMTSATALEQYRAMVRGVTTFDRAVTRDDLEAMPVPVPASKEQRAIADFLDAETARIDALIMKKRQIVSLVSNRSLSQQGSLACGRTTGGGHRPSRIPWLASLPSHWSEQRLKFVAQVESGHTPSRSRPELWEDCRTPWVTLNDVGYLKTHEYVRATVNQISEAGLAASSARVLPRNTVILSRDATVGRCGILWEPMATSQHFVNWVCGPSLQPRYLWLLLRTAMQSYFASLTAGATLKTIGMPDVKSFMVPLPPAGEQEDIVLRAEQVRLAADRAATLLEGQIDLLRERRQALITAAVTGELEIPGVAA